MLEQLISAALQRRWAVLVGMLVLGIAGFLSLRALNVDAFPDTTPVQVQINAYATSLVPEEIERQITFPIEMAMSGLPGLEEVRSISLFGLSQVVVTFRDGVDIYFARQLIFERLGSVQMPPGVAPPQMGPVSTGLGEVFQYALSSDTKSLTELRTLHDWTVKPRMRIVTGTAEINSWGGFEKQYQVRVDPTLLLKHDLSFEQVIHAVQNNNANVGGGSLESSGDMILVHGLGRTVNIEQIQEMVITAKTLRRRTVSRFAFLMWPKWRSVTQYVAEQ